MLVNPHDRGRSWGAGGALRPPVDAPGRRLRGASDVPNLRGSQASPSCGATPAAASPFTVASGVVIPAGGYEFTSGTTSYLFGQQRRLSGTLSLQRGQFYDGTITGMGFTSGRYAILKRWSVEPSVSLNKVQLPAGDFNTNVLRVRSDYGFSPRMFVSALVQYASAGNVFSSNVRFRWEYKPGSEPLVVYTDERDTTKPGYPALKNRAFVVKANRLFRF